MASLLWYTVPTQASAIISNFQPAERGKVTSLSDMHLRCCVPVGRPVPEPGRIWGRIQSFHSRITKGYWVVAQFGLLGIKLSYLQVQMTVRTHVMSARTKPRHGW